MTFQEIFNESGLYVAEGFAPGVCLKINDSGFLYTVTFKDENDLLPFEEITIIYKMLLYKDYQKVYTRQSLFKK